jgi:hypothetical protein
VVVTCEAKQAKDPILEDQIVRQVRATFKSVRPLGLNVSWVVPLAIKSAPQGRVYVVEFEPWDVDRAADLTATELTVALQGMYQLMPPVPGVGITSASLQRWVRKPAI